MAGDARGGRLACRRTSTPRAIPGRRYYGGCEIVDEIEQLAIDRAKALFGAEHANVQPHAGAQANMAVYLGLLQPGDTVLVAPARPRRPPDPRPQGQFLGPALHDRRTTACRARRASSTTTRCSPLAKEHRPKLILCGGSAYPRTVETWRVPRDRRRGGRAALVRHGALRGPRRRGAAPEPGRDCDVVTSTTHKTLAGPRAGSSSAARSTRRRSTAPSSRGSRAARSST